MKNDVELAKFISSKQQMKEKVASYKETPQQQFDFAVVFANCHHMQLHYYFPGSSGVLEQIDYTPLDFGEEEADITLVDGKWKAVNYFFDDLEEC